MALPINVTPGVVPAALTTVQNSTWAAADAASGAGTDYDSSRPSDAHVHLGKAALAVGQSVSGLAMVSDFYMSVAQAKALNAHLTALLALLPAGA